MPHTRTSLLLLTLFIASLTGCTTARIGSYLSPSDLDYPVENASPTRIVTIHGMLSPSLDIKLTAHYSATKYEGCRYTPTFIAGAIEGATFPIGLGMPLKISREREKYSTVFMVDRFQRGRCEWIFTSVSAEVSKAGLASFANNIVLNIGNRQPYNQENWWGSNSMDTAVVWRCRFSQLANRPKEIAMFVCDEEARKHQDKNQHLLNSATKTIEANFIDLESQ